MRISRYGIPGAGVLVDALVDGCCPCNPRLGKSYRGNGQVVKGKNARESPMGLEYFNWGPVVATETAEIASCRTVAGDFG
jgi:hypothetical protein